MPSPSARVHRPGATLCARAQSSPRQPPQRLAAHAAPQLVTAGPKQPASCEPARRRPRARGPLHLPVCGLTRGARPALRSLRDGPVSSRESALTN
eukprot:scaffold270_cov390-Prasinococcus_capsulatus_cf.AAC.1